MVILLLYVTRTFVALYPFISLNRVLLILSLTCKVSSLDAGYALQRNLHWLPLNNYTIIYPTDAIVGYLLAQYRLIIVLRSLD
jgi:hypothetical protein